MKFVSYDIELLEDIVDGNFDLSKLTPSVGALGTNEFDVEFYYDIPHMTRETSKRLVDKMVKYYEEGIIPFTWNGTSFDFQLLANYSGMFEECGFLALNHVDAMFMVVAHKGYFLGLDAALVGAGLDSKTHSVKLNSGLTFSEMTGKLAPEMWRQGEYDAVKTYLHGDIVQPLKLATAIEEKGGIFWTSKSGKKMSLKTKLLTVKECLRLPFPDVSWQTNPKLRPEFISWIPNNIINDVMRL